MNTHPPDHRSSGGGHGEHGRMIADMRRRFFVATALSIPILALSPLIQRFLGWGGGLSFPGDQFLVLGLGTLVYFYGGWPFLKGATGELRERNPGMMTLIALAITVAFVFSAAIALGAPGRPLFWELATLIDIMLLGHWIEMRSIMGASAALQKLAEMLPTEAHRVRPDGSVEEVSVGDVAVGDRLLIKPGERLPADGLVIEGRTSVNEAMLTGESAPVEKGKGDKVIGGAVNGEAAITITVEQAGAATYLSQIIRMVEEAQASRSRSQDLANRAARLLTLVAVGAGALTLVAWMTLGAGPEYAITRMVTVMVIACPHALGLAVPLVVAVSTSMSARHGLLIRDRSAFERAKDLQAVVFDKTGTLTEGEFGVAEVIALGSMTDDRVLALAAALEGQSEHPLATGIVAAAKSEGVVIATPSDVRAIPGKGVQGIVEGQELSVVSPGYLRENGIPIPEERLATVIERGHTVVYLLHRNEILGALALADRVREESRVAVTRLQAMGIRVVMLTGDAEPVARWVAQDLGLDDFMAEVLPDQKAARVRQIQASGDRTAMVGDGVNDAPALVQADVGIAIGAGTDVAVESADIILTRSDPRDVASVIQLARATYRKMMQNLWWAAGYNLVAIPLAAGVLVSMGIVLSPAAGAVLMSLSTVIVAINARLLSREESRLQG